MRAPQESFVRVSKSYSNGNSTLRQRSLESVRAVAHTHIHTPKARAHVLRCVNLRCFSFSSIRCISQCVVVVFAEILFDRSSSIVVATCVSVRRCSLRISGSNLRDRIRKSANMDDILPSVNIFRELQDIHDTGYFSARPSLDDYWQQVNKTHALVLLCICVWGNA